jgi:hypothetical protein
MISWRRVAQGVGFALPALLVVVVVLLTACGDLNVAETELTAEVCRQTQIDLASTNRASQGMIRAWRLQLAACEDAGLIGATW